MAVYDSEDAFLVFIPFDKEGALLETITECIKNGASKVLWFWLAGMILVATGCASASATEIESPLLYSGFAFSGDFQNRDRLYRYTAQIVRENGDAFLDTVLREKLMARPALAARMKLDLSDGKQDLSSVAFALAHENVETQKVDGKHWIIVTLQANVLAFNRASNSLVASYPLRMRVTRVRDSVPTSDELKEMVREVYTTANARENIFDQWLDRLESIKLRKGARKYLRVTAVTMTPEAQKVAVAAGKNVTSIENQAANFLEAAVAEQAGIPIVPNSVGEAIGSKMAYRFANGSDLQLTLPEPDYALTFEIRDFVSKKLEKPAYFQDIYRVKATVGLKQPDLGRVLLDEGVYDTAIITRPRQADVQLTDWDQYYKTLQSLILQVGKQMAHVDDSWLKDNASRAIEAKPAFQNTNQLLQQLL